MRLGEAQTDRSIWEKRKVKPVWTRHVTYELAILASTYLPGLARTPFRNHGSKHGANRTVQATARQRKRISTSRLPTEGAEAFERGPELHPQLQADTLYASVRGGPATLPQISVTGSRGDTAR